MKAVIAARSGSPDVLQLKEVDKPTPQDNEVLIRIHAATVTAGDVVLRKLPRLMYIPMRLMGLRRKEIPGHEFAGEVEAVGRDVSRFKAGDPVFGTTTGLSIGANAEYICLPADGMLAVKPASISFEEAAAIPVGGMTALHFLRQGNVQRREKVLIYGASGSVGTYAVQLAKHFGADVTGVASAANAEMVRSLGADEVIDYRREDFTESGKQYDLIFDAVGKITEASCKAALTPDGAFVTVKRGITKESADDLAFLGELAAAGKLTPVIDQCYSLADTAEAHRYVETGRKKGNVVITVGSSS